MLIEWENNLKYYLETTITPFLHGQHKDQPNHFIQYAGTRCRADHVKEPFPNILILIRLLTSPLSILYEKCSQKHERP